MIDVSKCEYEDSFYDGENECDVYYFTHPVALNEARFLVEPEDNVVSMCLALYDYGGGVTDLYMSPTVEEDGEFSDVDWAILHPSRNYTESDVAVLLAAAKDHQLLQSVSEIVLEDDGSPHGGTAFVGETVRDFMRSIDDHPIRTLSELNAALKECGIKPVSPK